jgi:hypothetical protein
MKLQRMLVVLTAANLVLLGFLLTRGGAVSAQNDSAVLRGRALEIVDAQGRVRASLSILPATPADATSAGQAYPETVILRLMNTRGRPAVKISTSDQGSGLNVTGSADSLETYVTMTSSGNSSQLKVRNEDGRQQLIKP